jgi:hypothetical protein
MKLRNLFLPARGYESEHTRFIRELMEENPELAREQKKSRAIWWDKSPIELSEEAKMDEGRVPQPAYVYKTD